jgi:hypothetical protein
MQDALLRHFEPQSWLQNVYRTASRDQSARHVSACSPIIPTGVSFSRLDNDVLPTRTGCHCPALVSLTETSKVCPALEVIVYGIV